MLSYFCGVGRGVWKTIDLVANPRPETLVALLCPLGLYTQGMMIVPMSLQSCKVERSGTVLDTQETVNHWGSSSLSLQLFLIPGPAEVLGGREMPHGSVVAAQSSNSWARKAQWLRAQALEPESLGSHLSFLAL